MPPRLIGAGIEMDHADDRGVMFDSEVVQFCDKRTALTGVVHVGGEVGDTVDMDAVNPPEFPCCLCDGDLHHLPALVVWKARKDERLEPAGGFVDSGASDNAMNEMAM